MTPGSSDAIVVKGGPKGGHWSYVTYFARIFYLNFN